MGARGARFSRRFGRLSGAHYRHPRGPIKAPRGWGEWAPGGRLSPSALGAFWAPIPVNRGGRSRPPRLTGRALGGRLSSSVLGAFWPPIPATRGGRSRPPRLTGMGARGVPFPCCLGAFWAPIPANPRGPIKAPLRWREWAPGGRLSLGVLGASRAPHLSTPCVHLPFVFVVHLPLAVSVVVR